MQFQLSPTPSQRRIRRIPTIRLQTMKHVRGNCMRNCWGGGAWPGFETTRRAKLAARTARGRAATHRHTQRPDTTGVEDAGGTGGHGRASRSTTPSRQARVWRSRGRPGPTAPGTPMGPQATQAGRPPPTGTPSSPAQQHTTRRPERQRHHKQHSTGARAHRPAPPALRLRRECSEVLTSRLTQLAQLVDGGDPAAALAFGGEQVHAADR